MFYRALRFVFRIGCSLEANRLLVEKVEYGPFNRCLQQIQNETNKCLHKTNQGLLSLDQTVNKNIVFRKLSVWDSGFN